MSFIVSAKAKSAIVIQSEGRSNRKGEKLSDVLQKIFPIADLPLAISHSGVNQFNKVMIGDLLKSISWREVRTHSDCVQLLQKHVSNWLKWCTCEDCKTRRERVTFFVHGFDDSRRPDELEVVWAYGTSEPKVARKIGWGHAHGMHEHVNWTDRMLPENAKTKEVTAIVESIFDDAMTRTDKKTCGGHVHSLCITLKGCTWLKVPASEPVVFE